MTDETTDDLPERAERIRTDLAERHTVCEEYAAALAAVMAMEHTHRQRRLAPELRARLVEGRYPPPAAAVAHIHAHIERLCDEFAQAWWESADSYARVALALVALLRTTDGLPTAIPTPDFSQTIGGAVREALGTDRLDPSDPMAPAVRLWAVAHDPGLGHLPGEQRPSALARQARRCVDIGALAQAVILTDLLPARLKAER
ncbi:hypothetical protein GCM10027160_29290 [Streptomyces calidiresistens]|uniref:Uncharacterized protein n=1 Tax=Streptomyces calidiresistens TaxID=1485586 RepID=A0A7W3T6L0_9ACTN|nr:hypothetical protein [Streptomyces calidiresistens]MBB0231888.1 hypothetical protein [Streptomyces calidiresistens]